MEIVIRATVLFFFLWLVTRATGKRQLAQLSAFELVLIIAMGDLVQQGVTQEDYSVTGAMLAVGTFAVLSVFLSYVSWRLPRTRSVLEGRPVVVIRDGRMLEDIMRRERLTDTELLEAARKKEIRDLAAVDLAVLENDGSISFFQSQDSARS
jgi:uncharacterized membrane protein YcaP (DUF421 family)